MRSKRNRWGTLRALVVGAALLLPIQILAGIGQTDQRGQSDQTDADQRCEEQQPYECTSDSECFDGGLCIDGACEYGEAGCRSNAECADDEVCLDGSCVLASDYVCNSDHDCYRGEICIDGYCNWVGDECADDSECDAGETCTAGKCVAQGEQCVWSWEPVCGVDGQTYPNACFANVAGVVIAHQGECSLVCSSDEECETGSCVDGVCVEGCGDEYQPVCGEDGLTYSNPCYAARAGVPVAFEGECQETPGTCDEVICPEGQHCEMIDVECPTDPCYPLPVCAPDQA